MVVGGWREKWQAQTLGLGLGSRAQSGGEDSKFLLARRFREIFAATPQLSTAPTPEAEQTRGVLTKQPGVVRRFNLDASMARRQHLFHFDLPRRDISCSGFQDDAKGCRSKVRRSKCVNVRSKA